jgi:hypothetical protein
VRAEDALEREVLMEDAMALMLYLNEYRSYMLSYTVGRGRVRELVERGSPTEAERWRRYGELMTEPVSTLTAK